MGDLFYALLVILPISGLSLLYMSWKFPNCDGTIYGEEDSEGNLKLRLVLDQEPETFLNKRKISFKVVKQNPQDEQGL